MALFKGNLSPLQNDFLCSWFRHTHGFFLTGGAVLVGFLGAPRITKDLDLFTTEKDAFDDAERRGEAKGKAEGKLEEKLEIAGAMVIAGYDRETVKKFTGFTDEELANLEDGKEKR